MDAFFEYNIYNHIAILICYLILDLETTLEEVC